MPALQSVEDVPGAVTAVVPGCALFVVADEGWMVSYIIMARMQEGGRGIEHDCERSRSRRSCWERRYDDLHGQPVGDGMEVV